MMLEYPITIRRSEVDPSRGTVSFPDFPDFTEELQWDKPDVMIRRAAVHLGTAYFIVEDGGGDIPKPSVGASTSTSRRVTGLCRCNYDKFKELALRVKRFDFTE